jgi:hypothetical protein
MLDLNPGSVAWSLVMRRSGWTPSIVPDGRDHDVYLVADDLGRLGGVWAEAAIKRTDLEAVIQDLLTGQFKSPIRVVAFNTAEEWSRDVSTEVARELRRRCDQQQRDVPFFLQDFVDRYEGRYRDIQLPLPMRLV